ncbi:uncharacterized protein [Macrobrachium rosenbergii]|uniref:uncharacterized protein n=1 Tax=Macrobrachium rosenbergii TaxID=79674 RepID=UPI0034D71923
MPVTVSTHFPNQVTSVPASQQAGPLHPGFAIALPSHAVPSMMVTSSVPHMMVPAPAAPVISALWATVAAPPTLLVPATLVAAPAVTNAPAARTIPATPVALAAPAAPVMFASPSWMGDLTTILKKMTKRRSRKRSHKMSSVSPSSISSLSSLSAASSPSSSNAHQSKKRKVASPPAKRSCHGASKELPPSTGEAVVSLVGSSQPCVLGAAGAQTLVFAPVSSPKKSSSKTGAV